MKTGKTEEKMIPVAIAKVVYPGKSLGQAEGKAVFTDEGLPGELVLVEPKKIKKSYIEGTTREILQASPRRQKPRCQHYRACSPYQVMDYEDQLAIKKNQLEEIFSRQLRLDSLPLTIIPSPLPWGYRNRAHFHLLWEDSRPRLAYHQPGSLQEFVRVEECFLLPEKVNVLLLRLLSLLETSGLKLIKEVEVRFSFFSKEILLVLFIETDGPNHSEKILLSKDFSSSKGASRIFLDSSRNASVSSTKPQRLREEPILEPPNQESAEIFSAERPKASPLLPASSASRLNNLAHLQALSQLLASLPIAGAVAIIRKKGKPEEQVLFGQPLLWEEVQGRRYALGPQTFFQVNVVSLDHLLRDLKAILSLSGQERLADLYCGVGTFGLALASQVAVVYGVELLPANIALLKKNLQENQISNFIVAPGMASQWAEKILSQGIDIAIVDPPRRGLEREVTQALRRYPSRHLLYLSCHPATQARDLGQLLQVYELQAIRFYDFFPQTPHIETLSILEAKN